MRIEPIPRTHGQRAEHHGVVGEEALIGRTNAGLERRLREQGRQPSDATPAELDALWEEAKRQPTPTPTGETEP